LRLTFYLAISVYGGFVSKQPACDFLCRGLLALDLSSVQEHYLY